MTLASPIHPRPSAPRRAFTLIELLVVVGIIGLLVAILLPALGKAREAAQNTLCLTRLHMLCLGVANYAADNNDFIPRGPDTASPLPASFGSGAVVKEWELASSIVWLGTAGGFNAHGVLLNEYIPDNRAMFCPGDDTFDPIEELAKIGQSAEWGFSSYLYRQLDQAPRGRLSDLGMNDSGEPARALFVDSNSIADPTLLGSPDVYRTNHRARPANVAYLDGHTYSFGNADDQYCLRTSDYLGGWPGIEGRYNQMFIAADGAGQ